MCDNQSTDDLEMRASELLTELIGKPLVGSHTTLTAESFLFGEYQAGQNQEFLAHFVIQADCPWRIECGGTVYVSYRDPVPVLIVDHGQMEGAIDTGGTPDECQETRGARLKDFYSANSGHLTVKAVEVGMTGDITITLENDCQVILQILDKEEDSWLFLRSGNPGSLSFRAGFHEYFD